MSLLKTIRDETLKLDCDVAGLLRMCKVLAVTLESPELELWAGYELNGYPEEVPPPTYRILKVPSKGHFSGPFGSGMRNADIPIHVLPTEFHEVFRTTALKQSVGALQELLRRSDGNLQVPWPMEALALYGDAMYEGLHCVQAWKVLTAGSVHGVLDAVKTKVLDFTLELQKAHPELMKDTDTQSDKPTQEEVKNVFHTTIYGSVGAIANARSNFSQNVSIGTGDLRALKKLLKDAGVPDDAVAELETAMAEDQEESKGRGKLGARVKAWLGTLLVKAGSGTWHVALETASSLIPAAIAGYLGISLG